jgi:hypothetical protein
MDDKQLTYLVVGGSILALVIYVAMCEGTVTNPSTEAVMSWNNPMEDIPFSFASPSQMVAGQSQMVLPHRYPNLSGTNISTLIHYGLSAMSHPSQKDVAWMVTPPSEDYF